jgi:hypothetical protein
MKLNRDGGVVAERRQQVRRRMPATKRLFVGSKTYCRARLPPCPWELPFSRVPTSIAASNNAQSRDSVLEQPPTLVPRGSFLTAGLVMTSRRQKHQGQSSKQEQCVPGFDRFEFALRSREYCSRCHCCLLFDSGRHAAAPYSVCRVFFQKSLPLTLHHIRRRLHCRGDGRAQPHLSFSSESPVFRVHPTSRMRADEASHGLRI